MTTLQTLLQKADSYKANTTVDNQDLRTAFIYSSNALEGNTLTLSETETILKDGIIINTAPLKDCHEITGLGAAFDAMLQLASHSEMAITADSIRELHSLLYQQIDPEQAGQYRTVPVILTGTDYTPPAADEIPRFMEHLADQISSSRYSLHPIELAAMVLKRLIDIHPFTGGNGQIARLLMNLILVNTGYAVVSIPPERRGEYQNALSVSRQQYDMEPFSRLVAECLIESYQLISRHN